MIFAGMSLQQPVVIALESIIVCEFGVLLYRKEGDFFDHPQERLSLDEFQGTLTCGLIPRYQHTYGFELCGPLYTLIVIPHPTLLPRWPEQPRNQRNPSMPLALRNSRTYSLSSPTLSTASMSPPSISSSGG